MLANISPTGSPTAYLQRKRRPWFQQHPKHGVTTYARVPRDRSIPVEDISHKAERRQEASGEAPAMVEGSRSGHYLEESKRLASFANAVVNVDYATDPEYRALMNILQDIGSRRNSWAETEAKLRQAAANPSTWMKQTWTSPQSLRRRRLSEPPRSASSETNMGDMWRLVAESIDQERHQDSPSPESRPRKRRKKPRRRFSSPRSSLLQRTGPSDSSHERQDSASGTTNVPRARLILHAPKPKEPAADVCSRCACTRECCWACRKCYKEVYCSFECQKRREGLFCSQLC